MAFSLSSNAELKFTNTSHSTNLLTIKSGSCWLHSSRLSHPWISFNACKAFFFVRPFEFCMKTLFNYSLRRQAVYLSHPQKYAETFFTAKQQKAVYWTNYTASARVAIPSPWASAFTFFLSWVTNISVCNDKYTLDKKKNALKLSDEKPSD